MATQRSITTIAAGACLALCLGAPLRAQDASPTTISVNPVAGMDLHYWKPGPSTNFVDHETEGLHAWWAEAALRIAD